MKNIRLATINDAQSILEIYQYYVLETPISFETEKPSLDEMKNRINETLKKFPWLVLEQDGLIQGYAYANSFKARSAYSWSVETTVYVRNDRLGQGIGKQLYTKLLDMLKDQGVVNVIGGVTLPNAKSVQLHESFGFTQVANFRDAGFKLSKWWDVGYWQLQFQKPINPGPLKIYCL